MTNAEYARGLHRLADWYDEHPDAAQPYLSRRLQYIFSDKQEFVALLREHGGPWTKRARSDLLYMSRPFGPFELEAIINQRKVCTGRIVGARVIPATPERTVDVVEWDCGAVLA